jgi:hypothetical protein
MTFLLAPYWFDPVGPGAIDHLLLSGDMSDGDDKLLLSGDMQSGTDRLVLSTAAGDAGYDIILLCGQSNMAGRAERSPSLDKEMNGVHQFGGYAYDHSSYQRISRQIYPLGPADDATTMDNRYFSMGANIGKAYKASLPPERQVLLVSAAVGGSSLTLDAPTNWAAGSPGGNFYEFAIAQAELALTAALAVKSDSRIVGIAWHQGEQDAAGAVSYATYLAALSAVITGFRARLTGASGAWFVIGGMVPESIAGSANYDAIRDAHVQAATDNANTFYVPGPSGQDAGGDHYTAAGYRTLGADMAAAVI